MVVGCDAMQCGVIVEVRIVRKGTGASKGFAYVEFDSAVCHTIHVM